MYAITINFPMNFRLFCYVKQDCQFKFLLLYMHLQLLILVSSLVSDLPTQFSLLLGHLEHQLEIWKTNFTGISVWMIRIIKLRKESGVLDYQNDMNGGDWSNLTFGGKCFLNLFHPATDNLYLSSHLSFQLTWHQLSCKYSFGLKWKKITHFDFVQTHLVKYPGYSSYWTSPLYLGEA